jgi:hypothetical protein
MMHPPFDTKMLNYIELANEVMVMACQYFMMVFACDIEGETLRSQLGFQFSMLVLVHLIVGFLALLITKIIKAIPAIKKVIMKIKEYWPKLKEKLCKPKVKKEAENKDNEIHHKGELIELNNKKDSV